MAREYGYSAPDDDSSKRIPKLLAKLGLTAGGLFLYASTIQQRVRKDIGHDVFRKLNVINAQRTGFNKDVAFNSIFKMLTEEGIDSDKIGLATTLKYAFGHSKLMDAIKFGSTHIKPLRILDTVFGTARLRETYGRNANLFQELGFLGENVALLSDEERKNVWRARVKYNYRLKYLEENNEQRVPISGKHYERLRARLKQQFAATNKANEKLNLTKKQLEEIADRQTRALLTLDEYKAGMRRTSNETINAARKAARAHYESVLGPRLFAVDGSLYGVNAKTGIIGLIGDRMYSIYGTAVRGGDTHRSWLEQSIADLTGETSHITALQAEATSMRPRWGAVDKFERQKGKVSRQVLAGKQDELKAEQDAVAKLKTLPPKQQARKIKNLKAEVHNQLVGRFFDFWDLNRNDRTKQYGSFGNRLKQIPGEIFSNLRRTYLGSLDPSLLTIEEQQTHKRFNPNDPDQYRIPENLQFRAIERPEFNLRSLRNVFFGGRKAKILPKLSGFNLNTQTAHAYFFLNRINNIVASTGLTSWLALSGKSAATPAHFFGSILFKRALPIFALAYYANWANSALHRYLGKSPADVATEGGFRAQAAWSGVKQRLGINTFLRHVDELSGGFVGYVAHPFMHRAVGLSPEEYRKQQETGYEEVRKGRWWWFGGSGAFRGERIQYYVPTALRFARAGNPYQTDTMWGSHDEYYATGALPTPDHPFAPIRHFITDRYHYERKHYRDRPYPLTAPLFEPTSPWGAILNPTLGRIIKPQVWMHKDDVPYILHGRRKGQPNPRFRGDARSIEAQINWQAQNTPYVGFVTPSGQIDPMQVVPVPGAPYVIDQLSKTRGEYHQRARERIRGSMHGGQIGSYGQGANSIAAYGSGGVKARKEIEKINKNLKAYQPDSRRGAKRFTGGALLEPITPPGLYKDADPNSKRNLKRIISPTDLRYQLGLGYYSATELGGLYGFAATSFTGDLYANRPTIADAGSMTSFERTYWDRMSSGGMAPTPGLSEAFRRFLPHRYHSNTMYNPIRNTMPTWMPGPEGQDPGYFQDFLHGDPYTRVPNGEIRLPGAGYEKLHGIGRADLKMRGSQLGYDESHMYDYLTGVREPFSPFLESIMERGHHIHSRVQARWKREGILEGAEVPIYDKENDISGTMDAILRLQNGQRQIAEIKTLSDQRWQDIVERHNLDPKHTEQLNFYMHQTGIHSGKLVYIRRSDNKEVDVDFNYNAKMWEGTVGKIHRVRDRINSEIDSGYWGPGALYSDIDKLRILADVAPWSSQYKRYRDYLVHLDEAGLSPEDRAQIREIKQQVTARKQRYNFSEYRLKYSALRTKTVTVDHVISPGTFISKEDPLHPVRLAGINLTPEGNQYLNNFIRPGRRVHIGVAADRAKTVSRDTLRTQRAVLYSNGRNVNRWLIQQDMATDTNENTPAGLHVHYTHPELAVGRFLEFIGHLPIPVIHNKFLPIDSPLELYKRTQVYGKDWQDWKHPIQDYLRPAFENWAQQGVPGVLFAGISTYLFLAASTEAKHKLPFAAMGAVLALGAWRSMPGNAVPDYRRKERDINEYFDVLKYLKYQGLYEGQRRWIARHEHHDIGELVERYENQGEFRKRSIQVLKSRKRKILSGRMAKFHREEIRQINDKIRVLSSFREELRLTRADALAIQYRNMARTTMYGAEPGGDMRKVLLAMPAKDREFFQEFVKAPTREHKEILRLVPENQRRFLQAAWGDKKIDERPELGNYFKHHYLPPRDWAGWSIHRNLDDYRLIVMKHEAMDMTAQGFWPQDEARVAAMDLSDIRPHRATRRWHGESIREQIEDVTAGLGLSDAEVQLTPQQFGQNHITLDVRDSRRNKKKERQEYAGASRLF